MFKKEIRVTVTVKCASLVWLKRFNFARRVCRLLPWWTKSSSPTSSVALLKIKIYNFTVWACLPKSMWDKVFSEQTVFSTQSHQNHCLFKQEVGFDINDVGSELSSWGYFKWIMMLKTHFLCTFQSLSEQDHFLYQLKHYKCVFPMIFLPAETNSLSF